MFFLIRVGFIYKVESFVKWVVVIEGVVFFGFYFELSVWSVLDFECFIEFDCVIRWFVMFGFVDLFGFVVFGLCDDDVYICWWREVGGGNDIEGGSVRRCFRVNGIVYWRGIYIFGFCVMKGEIVCVVGKFGSFVIRRVWWCFWDSFGEWKIVWFF